MSKLSKLGKLGKLGALAVGGPRLRAAPSPATTDASAAGPLLGPALDTLAEVMRTLGEFALPRHDGDVEGARKEADAWASHVAIASPAPGAAPEAKASARRDWEGLRRFVREHCQSSHRHAHTVVADLRETLWVFIRNLNQAFTEDGETDDAIRARLARLEALAHAATPSDLKREVLETASNLGQMLETRHRRHRTQMAQLGDRVRLLGSELESARRDGETDPVTAILNRKAFDEYLGRTVEICGAFAQPASLLLIDIDHFKSINDTHGHTMGDDTLRQVSNAVVRVFLRKSDFCARYGGDELAVILRETAPKEAEVLAERVLRGVRAINLVGPAGVITPTVSIGVGGFAAGDDAKRWIDRADRGLYAAKQAGRNRAGVAD
jgi:diguanylate cyclase (GGDEF)-like protein